MFREKCLICGNNKLEEIIDLGMHPFADTFIPKSRVSEPDLVYPLICDMCLSCNQVQTRCITNPQDRYAQHDYSYTSSNSEFSRAHWDKFIEEVSKEVETSKGFIVEIGSNDGYLSEQFVKKGNKVLGVDPSLYMAQLAKQRGVDTLVSLFEKDVGKQILEDYGKADLVVANNVFNHSDNPLDFTCAVSKILKNGGRFVFEQPYWPIGVKSKKFDQIYHEHVSYFTVKAVSELLKRAKLRIVSLRTVDYHGGSLRITAEHRDDLRRDCEDVKRMINEEEKSGIFKPKTYSRFMSKIIYNRNQFMQEVYKIRNEGIPIVAVGAAAKGNTFLNFYNLDNSLIDFVTDSSPHKQGKFTPATRIPIVGDEVFAKYKEVYALILSWNIANQLKEKLHKINPSIKFLVPE